jgi:lipopolysaccharide/colanic/teichoic acid biosynthesis glycosyltransferase
MITAGLRHLPISVRKYIPYSIKYHPKVLLNAEHQLAITQFCKEVKPNKDKPVQWVIKSVMEKSLALVGLVVTAPVVFGAGIAMKLTSKGPMFFTQTRVGEGGRILKIIKLRTMCQGAEDELLKVRIASGDTVLLPYQKTPNDPRVTPIGKWIRRHTIDEFPQFLNVLKGDMHLVGPRPYIPAEEVNMPLESMSRHVIKGALVPAAMAYISKNTPKELVLDRKNMLASVIRIDQDYIKNWSPLKDLKAFGYWIKKILKGTNC